MDFLESLERNLSHEAPEMLVERESASVATIFRRTASSSYVLEILLIRRAELAGDPWTGQVAFPGGKVHAGDRSFKDTAVRETMEEVGIDLVSGSRFLGYLRAFTPSNRRIVVVPAVFLMTRDAEIKPNAEVASHAWVPFGALAEKESRSEYAHERDGIRRSFPSFVFKDYMIWGLTERILSSIIEMAEADETSRKPS